MKRGWMVILAVCWACGGLPAAWAADAPEAKGKADAKAPAKAKDRAGDPAVDAWYDRFLAAYRKADWLEFRDLYKDWSKMRLKLSQPQRSDVIYMRKTAEEFRPAWWKYTRSTKNTSFKARIWGRWFTANYVPSESLGQHQPVAIRNGRLLTVVQWRPTYVDNPKPFSNDNSFYVFIPEAKDYGFTIGTMAEVIIWHELGHNYICLNLPLRQLIRLHDEYSLLYMHLQEFYADLTALYHASLPGRLFTMKLRLMSLVDYDENDVHTRGCTHAVGALLLAKMLSEPDQWPSVHFPGKVPKEDVERYTIFYVYRHIDPGWTLAEDRRLREFVNQWVRSKGESALRRKGRISLPNGQTMMLLAGEDRENQRKRDLWIKRKLEAIIASGRADKPDVFEKDMKDIEHRVRFVPVRKFREDRDEDGRASSGRRPKKKSPPPKRPDDDLDDVLGEEDK
ncbi:MAG: hypothetical protein JW849_05455 [Phycisphaerae bacterium]|nr:hypothetical protein [Phycisphaerae bacterium]